MFAIGEMVVNSFWFIVVDCVCGLICLVIIIFFDLVMLVIFGVFVVLLWDLLQVLFVVKDLMIVKLMFDFFFEVVKLIIFLVIIAIGYWFVV